MTSAAFDKRLSALEERRAALPVHLTPEEAAAEARRYAESLADPPPPDPRAVAYWAGANAQQLAADLDAMIKGASAPWE